MGNVGSNLISSIGQKIRHRRGNHRSHNNQKLATNQRVYAAAYTSTYPNLPPPDAPYFQLENGARYPPPPFPVPESHDDAMKRALEAWVDGAYPPVYVDYKTVAISNAFNLKKETLKFEADEENPGTFLVSFTFDATVPCNITLYFFQKEGSQATMEEDLLSPLTLSFQEGVGQIFRQKPGAGIDLSALDQSELCNMNETSVYPLTVKVEFPQIDFTSSEITSVVFEKDKDKYKVRVVKQMLLVDGVPYDMEDIYGFGNSDGDDDNGDGNDIGKICVICLSEPRDTTVLPCRHMCMCNVCAEVLRFQTNIQCPICRQPVGRLLEIKVNTEVAD